MPKDITFSEFYDEAGLLRDSNSSLRDAILVGAVLGALVLWLFLRSLRSTLIVVLCLPMTVLIPLLALDLLHQTLNIMTLGGLAVGIGLVIDDVVVTMENIFRCTELGEQRREAAAVGTAEIMKPMVGSALARIAVLVPLAFLSGITGAFFAPLSITLATLLVVSPILALSVVPLVCARLIPPGRSEEARAGGAEVQRPLVTVVIGGPITPTMLTPLVLPSLYAWFEARTVQADGPQRHVRGAAPGRGRTYGADQEKAGGMSGKGSGSKL